MGNRYLLKIAAIGRFPELEIDRERFDRIKASMPILSHALSIEEKYEILIKNFLDLELESLNISATGLVRSSIGYNGFFNSRSALNVRIVNILTATRLYGDQLPGHVCACLSREKKDEIKSIFSKEYDASFEYRFIEALRNYVQHSGIPIHKLTVGEKWTNGDDRQLECSVNCFAQRKELESDGGFKKQVLDEMPEEVGLLFALRVYVEAISRIHEQVRELIGKKVESSRIEIEKAISDYKVVFEKEPVGLHAHKYEEGKRIDSILITLKWDDVRLELVRRNGTLTNLRKMYVSSKSY